MKKTTLTNSFAAMLALVSLSGQLHAQSDDTTEFVPFDKFLESTRAVNSTVMNRPDSRIRERKTFEEMRRHVLGLYAGVHVTHSFVKDSAHFDCVPVEQQPSVRQLGLDSIADAPPDSLLAETTANDDTAEGARNLASQDAEDDQFGNATTCEANTIPMRRITLEELVRFSSLREFFDKGPDGAGRALAANPEVAPASPTDGHKYAIMFQNVNNTGGSSSLNLWNPTVNTALGELMSLSQEWYVSGSGASTQTAEVGWQVQPNYFRTTKTVLFIYWTADDYSKTGCYNLTCAGFVQKSNAVTFGAGYTTVSTQGGTQYDVTARYYFYQGNWWLAINGTWIGYYPGSIYRGGQMSKYATEIEYGTESVGSTIWPAEGSGQWATRGFGYAAYQRNMNYSDTSGNIQTPSLKSYQPSPKCYNTYGPFTNSSSDWKVFFYVGGPGGSGC